MYVYAAELRIYAPDVYTLKEKRSKINRVLDRVKNRYKIAIAETGDQDLYQSIVIGLAAVSNEASHAEHVIHQVISFIESKGDVDIVDINESLYKL